MAPSLARAKAIEASTIHFVDDEAESHMTRCGIIRSFSGLYPVVCDLPEDVDCSDCLADLAGVR
jgi:hypothetical protein